MFGSFALILPACAANQASVQTASLHCNGQQYVKAYGYALVLLPSAREAAAVTVLYPASVCVCVSVLCVLLGSP